MVWTAMGFAKGPTPPFDICLGKIVEPIQQIRPTGKSPEILSIPVCKNILLFRNANQAYIFAIPSHQEGRYAIVTFAGRDAEGATDERAGSGRSSRVVLAPRRWSQVLEKRKLLRDDGGKQARFTEEITKQP